MARLLMRCGCEVVFRDGESPCCGTHQEVRVVRTIGMPAPRFRGTATGPHVTPEDLAPWTGQIVGADTKES